MRIHHVAHRRGRERADLLHDAARDARKLAGVDHQDRVLAHDRHDVAVDHRGRAFGGLEHVHVRGGLHAPVLHHFASGRRHGGECCGEEHGGSSTHVRVLVR